MKVGRLVVFGVAGVAAMAAAILGYQMVNRPAPAPQVITQEAPKMELDQVLVASREISVGTTITPEMLKWQEWPKEGLTPGYITRTSDPDAMEKATSSIARAAFFEGEPIRIGKLVNSDRGYMSAILPAGQRAIATNISTSTSAGGFILPNDHVDVIMTRRAAGQDKYVTETILENVRVLAIDQTVDEKDGESVVVGETATLQLSPEQAKILVVAQQMADRLTLALRSLEDSKEGATKGARYLLSGKDGDGRVQIIKYGKRRDLVIGQDAGDDEDEADASMMQQPPMAPEPYYSNEGNPNRVSPYMNQNMRAR